MEEKNKGVGNEIIKYYVIWRYSIIRIIWLYNNQPSFDPNKTEVKIIDGKSYNIPLGATPSPYVDAKVIKFYKKIGLNNCNDGDITWEEKSATDEMSVAIANGDKDIYRRLAQEGRIGCSSPIK